MSLGGAIAGVTALKILYDALSDTDANHDGVLQDAYNVVQAEVSPTTKVYTDHLNVAADGNPRSTKPGDNHVPDLVVKGFADRNLVVEVETGDTIDKTAVSQMKDFATPGYTRVLVVPNGAVDDGVTFLEESMGASDKIVVSEPRQLHKLL